MNVLEKLTQLRCLMKKHNLDIFIIPSNDPHLSEYTPKYWQTRAWISGFSGSAGTVVVTQESAGLWTDARYFIQAEKELQGSTISLFKQGCKGVLNWPEWILQNTQPNQKVGCLGSQFSESQIRNLRCSLTQKQVELELNHDLISEIWTNDRPSFPSSLIREQEIAYSGKSREDKIKELRFEMTQKQVDWYFSANLDAVSWLLNVRADDILYCPFVTSYVLIGMKTVYWFVDSQRVSIDLKNKMASAGIEIKEYRQIIKELPALIVDQYVYFTPEKINALIADVLIKHSKVIEGKDIITLAKAIKNDTEIANFYSYYRYDGVALVNFYYWLEKTLEQGQTVSELLINEKLSACRLEQPGSCGDSFSTIAAYGEHAAMCHYSANEESSINLQPRGLLLIDSGGQYLGATTDITRTIALGECTEQEKIDYTLVLKGHIAVSSVRFLEGCNGANIDILARLAMWKQGIDFKHGTGHGVGNNLSVHEGPQGISLRSLEPIRPGMVITVEPGIYRENQHGIRLENVVCCKKVEENEFGGWLIFDPLTLFPFDQRPLVISMLTDDEKEWLNKYHQRVYDELSPFLAEAQKQWLAEKTKNI